MDHRVKFDFELDFSNGGGMQGQEFRLDIPGESISDQELAQAIVRDMRLLMVGDVRILKKEIVSEPHKRRAAARSIDLSHTVYDGLITYKGLPAPVICDYLSREASREHYAPGTEFQIGRIEMIANTGTYVDCPFHRYADGKDLSEVGLEAFADLEGVLIRLDYHRQLAVTAGAFKGRDVTDKAVLVHTGWAEHWDTEAYFDNHPFLTEDAAVYLRDHGAKLVGIDALNIDDTRGKSRPVHSTLLRAEILVVEHLCNLESLPEDAFCFSAIPPKFKGVGTFPVRAFARLL
ncbi:MAG: cyclase family protein [Chloroflexota bacterium]